MIDYKKKYLKYKRKYLEKKNIYTGGSMECRYHEEFTPVLGVGSEAREFDRHTPTNESEFYQLLREGLKEGKPGLLPFVEKGYFPVQKGALFPKCELACSDNTHDCYIHSLINLKFIPPEFARPLSNYLQINQTGADLDYRWTILTEAWPEFNEDYEYLSLDIQAMEFEGHKINDMLEHYYKEMPIGYGIEITIDFKWPINDPITHSVVLYKDSHNQLHIDDPQLQCRKLTVPVPSLLTDYYKALKERDVKFYEFTLTIPK